MTIMGYVLFAALAMWTHYLAALVLLALVGVLYFFGGMSASANDPVMKDVYLQLVESGQVSPVEQRFVIPIPGCTCHSSDPYLTEQHRNRRIRECMGCHGRQSLRDRPRALR